MSKLKRIILSSIFIILIITVFTFSRKNVSYLNSSDKSLLILSILLIGLVVVQFSNKKIGKTFKEIIEWIYFITLTLSVMLIITTFFIFTSTVKGESMNPTLKDKEFVFTYIFNYKIEKDDIVVYDYGSSDAKKPYYIVKRVAALEGDVLTSSFDLELNKYILLINGVEAKNKEGITYSFKNNNYYLLTLIKTESYTLKKDEVILLGDNVENSSDSRDNEMFSVNNIIGKVLGHK